METAGLVSFSLAINGTTDFVFSDFIACKQNSSGLSSFAQPAIGGFSPSPSDKKTNHSRWFLFFVKNGDGGTRTRVQNGPTQTSTCVDSYYLDKFRKVSKPLNLPKYFFRKYLTFNGCLDVSTVINTLQLA